MTAPIELPRYRGIEEAIADVRAYGTKTGCEKLIGLRKDGTRAFEAEGTEHCVALPLQWTGHCQGVFLVHCHPSMPTELSMPDIDCYTNNGAAGNLAVCCQDGSISWTDDQRGPKDPMFPFISYITLSGVANGLGAEPGKNPEDDWKWVMLAHEGNKRLKSMGYLSNYHVWLGDVARECLRKGGYHGSN